jgi:hypothetical protein
MNDELLRQALGFIDDKDEYDALTQIDEELPAEEPFNIREDYEYDV